MMWYVQSIHSEGAPYPGPQGTDAPGLIPITDEQCQILVEYNGFVVITQDEGGVVTVEPNVEAWEAWKAAHPEPDPTEELAKEARAQRDKLLAETDWTQVLDAPISAESREAYRVYRQALRDVPEQEGFPERVQWPVEPVAVKAVPDPVDTAFDTLIGGADNA